MERNGEVFQIDGDANPLELTWVGREKQSIEARLLQSKQGREILWLNDPALPAPIDVHAVVVVAGVFSAIPTYLQQGYTLAIAPFTVSVGRGAVVQSAAGTRICLLERSRVLASRLPEADKPRGAGHPPFLHPCWPGMRP